MCSGFLTNKGALLELCMRTCVVPANADINMTTKAHCMNIVNWMFFLISRDGRYRSADQPKTSAELGGFLFCTGARRFARLLHWPTCLLSMKKGSGVIPVIPFNAQLFLSRPRLFDDFRIYFQKAGWEETPCPRSAAGN